MAISYMLRLFKIFSQILEVVLYNTLPSKQGFSQRTESIYSVALKEGVKVLLHFMLLVQGLELTLKVRLNDVCFIGCANIACACHVFTFEV